MSNSVRNSVCNAVTNGVRNGRCTWVQNQNQNQTVFKSCCFSWIRSHSSVAVCRGKLNPSGHRRLNATFMNDEATK